MYYPRLKKYRVQVTVIGQNVIRATCISIKIDNLTVQRGGNSTVEDLSQFQLRTDQALKH